MQSVNTYSCITKSHMTSNLKPILLVNVPECKELHVACNSSYKEFYDNGLHPSLGFGLRTA